MDWNIVIVAVVVVAAWLLLKRRGLVDPGTAGRLRAQGAPVVDVRTKSEFAGGALPGAIHIPLDQVASEFPRRFPDRSRPLLLYCASGTRSGIAAGILRRAGYTAVFNLGGLGRATSLLGSTAVEAGR